MIQFDMDSTLTGMITGQESLSAVSDQIRGYIQSNYASVNTLQSAMDAREWNKPALAESGKSENRSKFQIATNVKSLLDQPRDSGLVGEELFINPFATLNQGNSIVTLDQLVTVLFQRYKDHRPSAEQLANDASGMSPETD
jgi:hypothetical protein